MGGAKAGGGGGGAAPDAKPGGVAGVIPSMKSLGSVMSGFGMSSRKE
jgi:hypothetical protein